MIQGVEAAITLLFESGEAASEEMVKTNCGALGPLALGKSLTTHPVAWSFKSFLRKEFKQYIPYRKSCQYYLRNARLLLDCRTDFPSLTRQFFVRLEDLSISISACQLSLKIIDTMIRVGGNFLQESSRQRYHLQATVWFPKPLWKPTYASTKYWRKIQMQCTAVSASSSAVMALLILTR